MSGVFPSTQPDWSNLTVLSRNTLPPRSHFYLYDSESAALSQDPTKSSFIVKLSGPSGPTWKFNHSTSPYLAPQNFESTSYDVSKWATIPVPSMWQFHNYGHPHYTNVVYPFPAQPPQVPTADNETGSYVTHFLVPRVFSGKKMVLRFDGVDAAFHVWINGVQVGYAQGSRNCHEFDVSTHFKAGLENCLAVRVYRWCDGSFIEDQDQWWLSGIFRDVWLLAEPKGFSVLDFKIDTRLEPSEDGSYDAADGELVVDVWTAGSDAGGEVLLKLLDNTGTAIAGVAQNTSSGQEEDSGGEGTDTRTESNKATLMVPLVNPKKWSAEEPNLYTAVLSFGDHFITQRVGFRKIEIKNGIFTVNGKRIVFRGTNRHEHHPLSGRTVPYEWLKRDLLLMKTHNINAIRTCHQPSDPKFYDLADELGFWIMDEADLECHGFAAVEDVAVPGKTQKETYDRAARYTSDKKDWEAAYVDRAVHLVQRDKNHPCVIMWSLGNEAFYGRNHKAMYDMIKSHDTTRPVHYESDWDAETVDLYSRMYATVDEIIEFAESDPNFTKPLVLCEFVHAMGNGPGNIKEYVDAFYKYPRLQGGWVWEWANHGLKTKTREGEEYYGYGGDFGDEPNDYNFVMDGVCFSNHTPTPGLLEYKKAIEPVQVVGSSPDGIEIINRYDIVTLNHLKCHCSIISDGMSRQMGEITIPEGVSPGDKVKLGLPEVDLSNVRSETFLRLEFSLKESTNWAQAGHVVASSQVQIKGEQKLSTTPTDTLGPAPTVSWTSTHLTVTSEISTWTFDLVTGVLTSWLRDGVELIYNSQGPQLTFYRALTDNDRPQDGAEWRSKYLHMAQSYPQNVTWEPSEEGPTTKVTVTQNIGPPVLNWSIATDIIYTCHANGTINIKVHGVPSSPTSDTLPATLARIGLTFSMPKSFDTISWFGRGPGECYNDSKLSQHIDNYTANTVEDLWVDYEFPQECSNRTDVRWVRLESSSPNSFAGSLIEKLRGSESGSLTARFVNVDKGKRVDRDENTTITTVNGNGNDGKAVVEESPYGNFMISHYTTADLDAATHPYELRKKKREEVIVRLDWVHHGLGTGSCGQKTLDQYALKCEEFEFAVHLE